MYILLYLLISHALPVVLGLHLQKEVIPFE